MEFTLTFIRGAFTQSDREERFSGRIDCPPHPDSIAQLREKARLGQYPKADAVFSSPLARCLDSARTIYPDLEIIVSERLSAFDYGVFSGSSYSDIVAHEQFADWAKSDHLRAFPQGESPHAFIGRCGEAMHTIIAHARQKELQRVSVITHQAVISAILQRYCIPYCLYRDYKLDYGAGISLACQTDAVALKLLKTL